MGELMLASAIIGAVGGVASGVAQSKAANYQAQVAQNNATIARQNARTQMQEGEVEATNQGLGARDRQGRIVGALAASGVDVNSGSAAAVRESGEEMGLMDTMTIRSNAASRARADENQASNFQSQSALDKAQGNNAEFSSFLSAASSVAGGMGKFYQQGGSLDTGWS